MIEGLLGKRAEVFDVDDTLVFRHPLIRVYSALKSRNPLSKPPVEDIPDINHQRTERIVTGRRERMMLAAHTRRAAIPAMRALLIQSFEEGAHIFVLTGRSSDSDWYDGTENQLDREGILPYVATPDRRLHTPDGKKTALSKTHGLSVISRSYESTRFSDDDWPTIQFGAASLPNVAFRYVYHGFPAVYPSNRVLEEHPNISVLDLTKI